MEKTRKPGGFIYLGGWAAWALAAVAIISGIIIIVAGLPHTGAGPEEVVHFYATNTKSLAISSAITPVCWLFGIIFGVAVVRACRLTETEKNEGWSIVGLGGLIMQCCMFGVLIAVRAALDVNASIKSTDQGLAALHDWCVYHQWCFHSD